MRLEDEGMRSLPDYILDQIEGQSPPTRDGAFDGIMWYNPNPEENIGDTSEPEILASNLKERYRELFRVRFWTRTRNWIIVAFAGTLLLGLLSLVLNDQPSLLSVGIWYSIFGSSLLGLGKLKSPTDVWRMVMTRTVTMDATNVDDQLNKFVVSTLDGMYGFLFLIGGFILQLISVLIT